MKRRDFIKSSLLGAATVGSGFYLGFSSPAALATHGAGSIPRTLVHLMLIGGADFRYVFAPHPGFNQDFVDQFWVARNTLYRQGYPDYASLYTAEYTTVTDPISSFTFGVHNSCGWLAQQFSAGNVVIVANVFGSLNRRHDHSQLIVYTGDPDTGRVETNRNGWGGRLVELAGNSKNVVALSNNVPIFCNGNTPDNRLKQVFHAKDMRDISLPEINQLLSPTESRNTITRALDAYYQTRGSEVLSGKPLNWPYHQFFRNYTSLKTFGKNIDNRLAGHPLPASLANLGLNSPDFVQQCKNLYDSVIASDLIGLKAISMNYQGWDHHALMQSKIEHNLGDVFGIDGGLDTVTSQLLADAPGTTDNMSFVIGSDFGRQLAANGGLGSDHGRGNYSLLIGSSVNGGLYGEMFPLRESTPVPEDSIGRSPFEIDGQDILGLTSFERVLEQACNWAVPGSGSTVFPGASASSIEAGLDLSTLFSA